MGCLFGECCSLASGAGGDRFGVGQVGLSSSKIHRADTSSGEEHRAVPSRHTPSQPKPNKRKRLALCWSPGEIWNVMCLVQSRQSVMLLKLSESLKLALAEQAHFGDEVTVR